MVIPETKWLPQIRVVVRGGPVLPSDCVDPCTFVFCLSQTMESDRIQGLSASRSDYCIQTHSK